MAKVDDLDRKIDPDFFDVMIQCVSVMANVATLATAWTAIKAGKKSRNDQIIDDFRSNLRHLRRSFEDCFECLERILQILDEAHRASGLDLLKARVRFGEPVMLDAPSFRRVTQEFGELDMASNNARSFARMIQEHLLSFELPEMKSFAFNSEEFIARINGIIFDSRDFGDAMTRLRSCRHDAEDLIRNLERSIARN